MSTDFQFRVDPLTIDPATGRYLENPRLSKRIDRKSCAYLQTSIHRLSVMADRPLRGQQAICAALREYGHLLHDVQREILERNCWNILRK